MRRGEPRGTAAPCGFDFMFWTVIAKLDDGRATRTVRCRLWQSPRSQVPGESRDLPSAEAAWLAVLLLGQVSEGGERAL